ncbi:MAG: TlpA disulfide reductase family protein [Anaerovoracaceae bacterium]
MKNKIAKKKTLILITVLVFALAFTACGGAKSAEPAAEKAPQNAGGSSNGNTGTNTGALLGSFKGESLDGTEINQEIFAQNKYTLIEVWATYCGPCIKEMPIIEKIGQKYKDKGIGVLGIVTDAQEEDFKANMPQVELAKEIIKKEGATYPNMLIPQEIFPLMAEITGTPSAFLVDSQGNIASKIYAGALSEKDWSDILDQKFGL